MGKSCIFQEMENTLKERIMIMDGGMGTMIQNLQFEEEDFRGKSYSYVYQIEY